ncbi:MAG: hypothetical protein H6667_22305 [Ardenticatenaceae bacterium]|nr:hypothetical protein [Ardenticatenaceae bacterium]MCB9444829.1 hypothetical protein [Ardenticatenaceae bacterium]
MRQHRLVTRFLPVKKTAVITLKRLNEFRQIRHDSTEWTIFVSTGKNIFLPDGAQDIAGDIILNRIPRQKIIIFESDAEAFVVVCQDSFVSQLEKVAGISDSEKTLAYVRQLAPKG